MIERVILDVNDKVYSFLNPKYGNNEEKSFTSCG